ncbi:MAG: hypothetical protein IIA34_11145, partial [Proteobacteria bacterium]|nr:hypothetical protein [Pseudomonadota bacterium]
RIKGVKEVQEYLLNAIQEVYRLQGVGISDRHIECIVRQMLQNVKISEPGDTDFLMGETVTRWKFAKDNDACIAKGGKEAQADPVLLDLIADHQKCQRLRLVADLGLRALQSGGSHREQVLDLADLFFQQGLRVTQ